MSRVVFLNVSAAGHVIPTLGLVTELINRGEEVLYYEDARFQKEIKALGALFKCYPSIDGENSPPIENELSLVPQLTWYTTKILPELLELVKSDRPDYILHDSLCMWGRLVAQLLDIPAVNLISTAAFCAESFYECQHTQARFQLLLDSAPSGIDLFKKYAKELQETYQIAPIDILDTFTNLEPVNICYLPRELQPYAEKFDRSFHFVGPCGFVRGVDFEFPISELDGKKIILISFGNIHDPGVEFYQSCIEAFGPLEVQVIIALSPAIEIDQLQDIPPNFIIRPTGTIPQLQILERASIFIMHGAAGGAREATWYSVPMITIPQTYEQELISCRLVEEGAGILLPLAEANAKTLNKLALQILENETYRVNSSRIAKASRAAGGASKAIDEIFRYVYSTSQAREVGSRKQGAGSRE